ncbi:MAG: hypothetical protein Q7U06_01750, partial [Pseudomonadota bacterium]|nr:hypothetical protein [Pseudomonadota bacterium]
PTAASPFRPAAAGIVVVGLVIGFGGLVGLGLLAWNLSGGFPRPADAPVEPGQAAQVQPVVHEPDPVVVPPVAPDTEPVGAGDDAVVAPTPGDPVAKAAAAKKAEEKRLAALAAATAVQEEAARTERERRAREAKEAKEAAEAATARAAAAATFPLHISTGAIGDTVWLDGTWLGTSPIRDRSFPAGAHTIVISKGDVKTDPYVVTLGADGPSRIVYVPTESKWRTAK